MTTTDNGTLRVLTNHPVARGGYLTVSGAYHVNRDGREVSGLEGLEVTFTNESGDFVLSLELPTARALIDALTEALGDAR